MSERRARRARRPDSARSQHFLRTQALAAELVRETGVGPGDLVLDLGAGSGRLTSELAGAADRVLALELDPHWAGRLRGRWENVRVVLADAAAVELPREPFRVVANLPFARTTAILRHLLDDPRVPLERADVIVEWSVAVKRALPWPSTVNDVLWGAWYSSAVTRRLPRTSFDPPPGVDAGMLVFERRPVPLVRAESVLGYRRSSRPGSATGSTPSSRCSCCEGSGSLAPSPASSTRTPGWSCSADLDRQARGRDGARHGERQPSFSPSGRVAAVPTGTAGRRPPEQVVAGRVPVAVVDGLEAVDAGEDQSEGPAELGPFV